MIRSILALRWLIIVSPERSGASLRNSDRSALPILCESSQFHIQRNSFLLSFDPVSEYLQIRLSGLHPVRIFYVERNPVKRDEDQTILCPDGDSFFLRDVQ